MNTRGIDSCKLLFPLSHVTYDERLLKPVYEVYNDFAETGEIIREYAFKPIKVPSLGFDTYYSFVNLFGKPFIYVLVNSKMLKERYFEAINSNTIQIVFNTIIQQKIINISYTDFLSARLTDIDIKADFNMYDEPFYRYCNDRKRALFYPKFYSTHPNIGLEYVKRNTATPANPYVKYYSKSHELLTRSKLFKDTYLANFHDLTLRRCEITIKNHAHKLYIEKKLFKLPTTLKEWVSLSQDEFKQIILHCVNQHEKNVKIPIDRKKYERNIKVLSSKDFFIYKIICELEDLGLEKKQILNLYTQRMCKANNTHYSEKSRINKMLRKFEEIKNNTTSLINPFL